MQLRRDLEDQEAATQDALRRAVAEEVKREDMVRRLRAEQVRCDPLLSLCRLHRWYESHELTTLSCNIGVVHPA